MPRQKTGEKLGRPFIYTSDEERPLTVSLRIPRDLAERLKRYAYIHRQSVTELLLDGLRWRLNDEEDPRWPSQNGVQDYSNAAITARREKASTPPPGMDLTSVMVDEDLDALSREPDSEQASPTTPGKAQTLLPCGHASTRWNAKRRVCLECDKENARQRRQRAKRQAAPVV